MAAIYLTLSKRKDTTGKQEILIRFKHNDIAQRAKTNIFIEERFWDDKTEQINPKRYVIKQELRDELIKLNDNLNKLTTAVQTSFNNSDKKTIAADWLIDIIDRHNFPEKYKPIEDIPKEETFFDLVAKFIKEAPNRKHLETGRKLAPRSIVKYNATEAHLKAFAEEQKKKDYKLSEIDKTFYEKFVAYLQGKKFTQNTVGKHIQVLKTMLGDIKMNINDFTHFKSFSEDTDTIYLNETELQQLKDTNLPPYLERVRDCFLLLAWTGCRYSDLEKIGKTDIKDGFITFRQQKTNNKVVIPLHPVVAEILEKYDYKLPEPITNQKFNEYIKEGCKRAKINSIETMTRTVGGKLETITFEKYDGVTSHTGRRSFATNMYKRNLPSYMIMSVTGHKTEKSFLKYIKVKQHEHAEMMKKVWEDIYKR